MRRAAVLAFVRLALAPALAGALGALGACGACGAHGSDAGTPADYPDLAVLAVPPDSFTLRADGAWRWAGALFPLRAVGRAFYAAHPDDYDFLVVFSDFTVADAWVLEDTLKNDVAGIGLDRVWAEWGLDVLGDDQSAAAGSAGRLQAVLFMNGPGAWTGAELGVQDLLVAELAHRWGAYLPVPGGGDPWALLDVALSHWAMVANVGAPGDLAYGVTRDNGDGTFTAALASPILYTPWELYTMGLYDPASLGDLFYVAGPSAFDPPAAPDGTAWTPDSVASTTPVTFAGTRVDVAAADVLADLGPRDPPFGAAPTAFRCAFVVLCADAAACAGDALAWAEAARTAWPARFAAATGGRASVTAGL